ncbi:MAG: A24 family peptidase [Oligoflexia bacterium]|nr:A24 family peptidase [Oligoflexia bacterium]
MSSSIDHGLSATLPFAAFTLGCAFAAILDLLRGRIPNAFTVPFFVLGLGISATFGGGAAVGDGLLGAALGLVLYGWMFWLGFMGGGDVKLLMALGAWGGVRFCAEVAVFAVLLGGALAVPLLLFKGTLLAFFRKLYRFVLSAAIKDLALEVPAIDRRQTMPYGVPLAVAAVWSAHSHPLGWLLRQLGVPLWF